MAERSDLFVDAKDVAVGAVVVVKHQLNLLEKQVRMLKELAEASAVVHNKQTTGDRQEQADFVVVRRERMREIVEQMTREIKVAQSLAEANLAFEGCKGKF